MLHRHNGARAAAVGIVILRADVRYAPHADLLPARRYPSAIMAILAMVKCLSLCAYLWRKR